MKIDLHSHTRHSDGHLSVTELLERAATMQVDVLAITDHDTLAGVSEAQDYLSQSGSKLQLISGVEISTRWHGFDIHVLGLHLDHKDPQLLVRMEQQQERRRQRALKIAEKLEKCGYQEMYAKAEELADGGQVTRAHFARVLYQLGQVKDMQQAFTRYLGKGKRAYVAPQWITLAEAVEWIHDAGGEAVLAHPANYDMTMKWLKRLLGEFATAGGDGMEVVHGNLAKDKQRTLAMLAKEYQLKASVGSDFHFPSRWTELGRNLSLPEGLTPIWQEWRLGPQVAV